MDSGGQIEGIALLFQRSALHMLGTLIAPPLILRAPHPMFPVLSTLTHKTFTLPATILKIPPSLCPY